MTKRIHDIQFSVFYFPKHKICAHLRCGRINLERMAIIEIILPYISCNSKAPNYRECTCIYMETKKAIFNRNSKERIPSLQLYIISVVNMNLFVWVMKAKVYKVGSCTVYFALNFHTNL